VRNACGFLFGLFPGDAKIERHVPAIPFSREIERPHDLRRALAIYRMVFGQSKQEDLIAYMLGEPRILERAKRANNVSRGRRYAAFTASEGRRSARDKSDWDCGSAPGSPCR
jgi:hypothetical protein